MNQRKTPILLFDIGNVFLFADHNITHKYLVKQSRIPLKKVKKFYKIPEYKLFSRGEVDGKKFAQAVRSVLGKSNLNDKEIKKAHQIHIVELIASAIEVLKIVHDRGYPIAFLTDTNAWQIEREKQLIDFSKFSEIIVRSNEEGLTKEDPELFSRTLERLKRKDVLFIDDNIAHIKTAKNLGIDSIHVTENNPKLHTALQSKEII